MADAPFDVTGAHRWFAVEANNLAWDLVEAQRSDAQTEQMIDAAHAACFHWREVGLAINQLRAQCLLATVYARAGRGEAAMRYAERCLALSAESPDGLTPFDRATAHGCAAVAFAALGRADEARHQHRLASEAAGPLDADDRAVFDRLYPVPAART